MDVRCENCHVEYELPDTKLRPGGVTVKCVECGHMFKIRKRSATNPGTPPAPRNPASSSSPITGAPPGRVARRPPTKPPPGARPSNAMPVETAPGKSGAKSREWLIRLDDGEIMRCQELSTLQQWIVGGQVSRQSAISRNGKTWKPLGEIAELTKYFDMVEQARSRPASSKPPSSPRPAPAGSPAPIKAPLSTGEMRAQQEAVAASKEQAARAAVQNLAPAATPPKKNDLMATTSLKALKPTPAPSAPADEITTAPQRKPGKSSSPVPVASDDHKTAGWAVGGNLRAVVDEGPRGPIGGLARGIPTDDVAFAKTKPKKAMADVDDGPGGYKVAPLDFVEDDLREVRGGGGAGKWLVLGSMVVIVGAAAAIYFLVLQGDGGKSKAAVAKTPAAATDAGAEPATMADAGAVTAKPVPTQTMPLARQAILGEQEDVLRGMNAQLAKLDNADKRADVVAMQAAVQATLAQLLVDRAAASEDVKAAKQLKRRANQLAGQAVKLANAALKLDREHAGAMVALADGLRVQGSSSRQIDRWLRKALKRKPGDSDAELSRAMLYLRDNKKLAADKLLKQLAGSFGKSGDSRPHHRLGLIALAAKDYDGAREAANAIISMHANHGGARALLARVRAATAVVSSDPMPPETNGKKPANSGGGGSYDSLLKRANGLAENGNCSAAMGVFQRALDVNPTGIDALTGLGYCHLDKRQFASAHDKFRAAMVISSRYQPAMKGIAEAYQQQGLKPQAIKAYKALLAAHPGYGGRAQVERMIVKLGGTVDGGKSGGTTKGSKPDGNKPDGSKPDGSKPDGTKSGGDGSKPKPGGDTKKPEVPTPAPKKPEPTKAEPKKPEAKPPAPAPKKSDDRTD